MVALYRLVELDGEGGGTIRMDGVDISTLGLDFLRQSMAIISQVSRTRERTPAVRQRRQ